MPARLYFYTDWNETQLDLIAVGRSGTRIKQSVTILNMTRFRLICAVLAEPFHPFLPGLWPSRPTDLSFSLTQCGECLECVECNTEHPLDVDPSPFYIFVIGCTRCTSFISSNAHGESGIRHPMQADDYSAQASCPASRQQKALLKKVWLEQSYEISHTTPSITQRMGDYSTSI